MQKYLSVWHTEFYIERSQGSDNCQHGLDCVTIHHGFILDTFIFWITTFVDNSKQKNQDYEHCLRCLTWQKLVN